MKLAYDHGGEVATNLGAVFIDDEGLARVNSELGFYWPWPRQLFGRVLRELTAQGAEAIACDVFFLERHKDFVETRIRLPNGATLSSDAFFAYQLRAAGNTILGCPGEVVSNQWHLLPPIDAFATNAMALAHASTDRDSDGVLRRAKPFYDDPVCGRVWQLGLRLAAVYLQLDLANAVVEPGRISLRGKGGVARTIPLDSQGFFWLDWSLPWYGKRLANATFEELLEFDRYRGQGETNLEPAFQGKLVVIGSIGSGSNVSDVGATPVQKETYLVSKHWNAANSLLADRFVRPPRWWEEILLIIVLGALSGLLTWRLRALWAATWVALIIGAYVAVAVWGFLQFRVWLPLALPVGGALCTVHVSVVAWRAVYEQNERKRVREVFSRIVSPEIVQELLGQRQLALGGTLREVTILFADIRGFTKLTDDSQHFAAAQIREQQLTGAAAEDCLAQNARETLATVNRYLGAIAETVKQHNGTLDKYIGDCVMAFWGAPVPNEQHAVAAVRAAIGCQQATAQLNRQRLEERGRMLADTNERDLGATSSKLALTPLSVGAGIHTGTATVGLMGSESHILNYTVFGREVNLASRLEGVSGHGRIVISESTHAHLRRFAPDLAARCRSLPAVTVKGISGPVAVFEVAWQESANLLDPRPGEADDRPA